MRIITSPGFKDISKIKNPYQYLLYTEVEKLGSDVDRFCFRNILFRRYDIIHVHWPESNRLSKNLPLALSYSGFFLFLLVFGKIKGAKIVWTVHNMVPHDKRWPRLLKIHFYLFTLLVDGIIAMNELTATSVSIVYTNLKGKKVKEIKHGNYKGYYQNQITENEAKKQLNISETARVCLFLGQIRPYKGIEQLVNIFETIDNPDFLLLIAGSLSESGGNYKEQLSQLSDDKRIKFDFKFVPDVELQLYFNACDLVILPFKSILNSGSMLLALSFNKPVLLPNHESVKEIEKEYGDKWVYTYEELSTSLIKRSMDRALMNKDSVLDMHDRDWDVIAQQTIDFYKVITQSV